ncbi:MAG: hypothetical protein RR063_09860 [Anaerovoracaceae bacterium]
MNTSFRILWFEDELYWFNMEKLRVEDILHKHYLVPSISRKKGDDFDVSELMGNNYDLILMDYKLANGATGDTIVAALRKSNVLTDILFYSSEEESMKAAICDNMPPIDGFYLTKRDHEIFTEKVSGIIRKIIKRSEDIVNLRGFVMDGSCDFEVRIHEILNASWAKFSQTEQKILEDATCRNIERNEKRDSKTREIVMRQKPLYPAAVNTPHFFTHTDRLYLLTKVIGILQKNYGFRKDEIVNEFKGRYENDVSCYRNALGHKKAADNHIEISNGTFVPVDETLHQQMRINLCQYNSIIAELEHFVTEEL